MAVATRHCLFEDDKSYSIDQIAQIYGNTKDWVKKTIIHPTDSRTKKPQVICRSCDAEFGFATVCPQCESKEVELVHGCPFTNVGSSINFLGADLNLWISNRARSRTRPGWEKYVKLLNGEEVDDGA